MVIAIDADGVLFEDIYPGIGKESPYAISILLRWQKEYGDKLILWTCRGGVFLADVICWGVNRGLVFDCVNSNLPERMAKYKNDSRKVAADWYIDDKANSNILLPKYFSANWIKYDLQRRALRNQELNEKMSDIHITTN